MDALYWQLRRYLLKQFGRHIRVTAERDRKYSYNFEVAVMPSGVLLHSRRLVKNEEFCDSVNERLALQKKIQTLLLAGADLESVASDVVAERRTE